MAKLIMYSSFLKNNKSCNKKHNGNLMNYIATREGVEYNSNSNNEVTEEQKKLINELVNEYEFIKTIDSFKDYEENKNKGNASQFLSEAFNFIEEGNKSKEIYLKYISERPNVQKFNGHGLFNDGVSNLKEELENIKNHDGVVWKNIISLRRDDAKRLGYDKKEAWQRLLSANMQDISNTMGIERKNLVWNAAFHDEGHHPHVHLVIYSKNKKEGFLNTKGIEKIKSSLVNEIFKNELEVIKEEKTLNRDKLKSEFQNKIDKIHNEIMSKDFKVSPKLVDEFIKLSKMIPNRGKLRYGYQKSKVKDQVDIIVKEMVKDKSLGELYKAYLEKHSELVGYYKEKENIKINDDITKNPDFRVLQNKILSEIKNLDGIDKIEIKTQLEEKIKVDIKPNEKEELKNLITDKVYKIVSSEEFQIKHRDSFSNIQESVNKDKIGFYNQPKEVQNKVIDIFKTVLNEHQDIKKDLDKLGDKKLNSDLLKEIYSNVPIGEEYKKEINLDDKKNIDLKIRDLLESKSFIYENRTQLSYIADNSNYKKDISTLNNQAEKVIKCVDDLYKKVLEENPSLKKIKYKDYLIPEYKEKIFLVANEGQEIRNRKIKELSNEIKEEIKNSGLKYGTTEFDKYIKNNPKVKELFSKLERECVNKDEYKNILLNGTSNLKKEYMFNKNIDVNYKDFSEKNKNEINSMVKGIINAVASNISDRSRALNNESMKRRRGIKVGGIKKEIIKKNKIESSHLEI